MLEKESNNLFIKVVIGITANLSTQTFKGRGKLFQALKENDIQPRLKLSFKIDREISFFQDKGTLKIHDHQTSTPRNSQGYSKERNQQYQTMLKSLVE